MLYLFMFLPKIIKYVVIIEKFRQFIKSYYNYRRRVVSLPGDIFIGFLHFEKNAYGCKTRLVPRM